MKASILWALLNNAIYFDVIFIKCCLKYNNLVYNYIIFTVQNENLSSLNKQDFNEDNMAMVSLRDGFISKCNGSEWKAEELLLETRIARISGL